MTSGRRGRRRAAERRGARAAGRPGRRARPAADRQWRIAGLPVSSARREVPAQVRELGEDRREDAGRSRGRSPRSRRPADRRRQRDDLRPAASSTFAASCGWTPTAASSQGNRSTSASAPLGTTRRSSPGRGSARRRPAGRRRSTRSTSPSNRSAWRWQWLSTRRTGGLSPMRLERRAPALAGQVLVERDLVALAVGADREPALAGDLGLRLGDRAAERLDLGDASSIESTAM